MCIMYTDTVNISFRFFKAFYFSSCLFSMTFTWWFPLYSQMIFWENLVSLSQPFTPVTLRDCFHTVLNIPCPSITTPSIGSLFTWMATHFCPVFGYEPLSYFIISVVYPLCSIITDCIFSTFPSYHIGFVCLPETSQMVSWFSEMTGLNSSAHGYHALLVFWEMSVILGPLQVSKLKGAITLLLLFPNA